MCGSGSEVSTLSHLQHGAVTDYSMAGDRGREGEREGGKERERERYGEYANAHGYHNSYYIHAHIL